MKNYSALLTTLIITLCLSFSGIPDAEAKRFGGARSFGGKSSYGSAFRRSGKSTSTRSPSQKKAFNKNQASRQAMSRRGGFMGMLGGLALGGLLGAMFFGGAFEGFNFMDILMFGGIAYLLFRLFASKVKRPMATNSQGYDQYKPQEFSGASQQKTAGFNTNVLFDSDKKNSSFDNNFEDDADFNQEKAPKGFDEVDFLSGAKGAFKTLQKAWDQHDLAEIRGLTTDKVFAEIQQQLSESPDANQTDVLKLDSELLSIRDLGNELEAVVLFNAIIREDVSGQAEQVREVWHFIKLKKSNQPKWFLDGIQQLEQ